PSRRITELAEHEGLAQPTVTILIKQLEEKGLVTRTRQSGDGRVVFVDLTEGGNVALEDYRGRLRAVLGGDLAEIADEQVAALATATETLAQLVDVLQQPPARGAGRAGRHGGTMTNPTFAVGGDIEVRRLGFGAMRITGPGTWGP